MFRMPCAHLGHIGMICISIWNQVSLNRPMPRDIPCPFADGRSLPCSTEGYMPCDGRARRWKHAEIFDAKEWVSWHRKSPIWMTDRAFFKGPAMRSTQFETARTRQMPLVVDFDLIVALVKGNTGFPGQAGIDRLLVVIEILHGGKSDLLTFGSGQDT